MRTAQSGDRVQIHFVKRWLDGSAASSRGRAPLELTVGVDHPRLPGLGLALVGMTPGTRTTLLVPAEKAYGASDPQRIYRLARTRFSEKRALGTGKWVRLLDRRGRHRLVRILFVRDKVVVVDTNHPRAGQDMVLEVELLTIRVPNAGVALSEP